jgi:hypothetical protein
MADLIAWLAGARLQLVIGPPVRARLPARHTTPVLGQMATPEVRSCTERGSAAAAELAGRIGLVIVWYG